ncbi:hypothetical protein FX016_22985 [Cupriavidus gilardii]|nr:hypothetical protein FX016_22985 [Cupriavidus gilardii]
MVLTGSITDRVSEPSPEEVRAARERAGLDVESAGALVSSSAAPRRTWEKWEKPIGTANHRAMPISAWELFLLATDQHPTLRLKKR